MNPVPLIASALTVTDALPVEVKASVCVVAEFTETLPKFTLEGLMLSVDVPTPSCREKVSFTPPALAVNVTVAAVPAEDTVAAKLALLDPAGTVTEFGTVTAELLLANATASPPLAAAVFSVTVQLSVPAPVIDPFAHVNPVSTGTPVPLRPIVVELPVDELLISVSAPVTEPAAIE